MEKVSKAFIEQHVAVCCKDRIVVLSAHNRCSIWIYNLWTEQWKNYTSRKGQQLPIRYGQVGVEIGSDIYMYGGFDKLNMLWRLTRSTNKPCIDIFYINRIKRPSPRKDHSVWQYGEKMWIFGGLGGSPVGYFSEYGDFIVAGRHRYINNQLFCYDPFSHMWTNVECCGDIPAPQAGASAAVMKHKVYLCGGYVSSSVSTRLRMYELSIHSMTWTQIEFTGLRYNIHQIISLTSVRDNELVLHSNTGYEKGFTRILDAQSHTWKEHLEEKMGYGFNHTGTTGLHGSVIILGKTVEPAGQAFNPVITVRLEPKSLQQLAIQMIYQNLDSTLWKMLPKKLEHKIIGSMWKK